MRGRFYYKAYVYNLQRKSKNYIKKIEYVIKCHHISMKWIIIPTATLPFTRASLSEPDP